MAINYKKCPRCGSKNSIRIIYGMPEIKLAEMEATGKIKLGGCCIVDGNPEYFCRDCEYEWNRQQVLDAAYDRITYIEATVGGYFGGHYTVTIDFNSLVITWKHPEGVTKIEKSMKSGRAKDFRNQLKSTGLLNWKSKYIEPGVLDGTQWHIDICTNGRKIRKVGDNDFPDEWGEFCKFIEDLTGQVFR